MANFEATMRVVHIETWCVEAKDENEARAKFDALAEDVETDEFGGEVVDWEVTSIKEDD